MEFKLYQELLNDTDIMSYVFLESLPEDVSMTIADETNRILEEFKEKHKDLEPEELSQRLDQEAAKRTINIELTIDGHSVDPRRFFQLYNDQMDVVIRKTADRIVKEQTSDKLQEVSDKIFEMQEVLNDMSNDINWDYDPERHPFIKHEKLDPKDVRVRFMDEDCWIELNRYEETKAINLQLMSKESGPVCTATINLKDTLLESDDVIIKNHGKNENVLEALVKAGVVFRPHREINIHMPEPYNDFVVHVCKLNLKLPDGF